MAGPAKVARLPVNPALRAAVHASGRPGWLVAAAAGIVHTSRLSALINATEVAETDRNVERLLRIAEVVGFPADKVFERGSHHIPAPPVGERA